jgi:hypothetical protein
MKEDWPESFESDSAIKRVLEHALMSVHRVLYRVVPLHQFRALFVLFPSARSFGQINNRKCFYVGNRRTVTAKKTFVAFSFQKFCDLALAVFLARLIWMFFPHAKNAKPGDEHKSEASCDRADFSRDGISEERVKILTKT